MQFSATPVGTAKLQRMSELKGSSSSLKKNDWGKYLESKEASVAAVVWKKGECSTGEPVGSFPFDFFFLRSAESAVLKVSHKDREKALE